MQSAALAERPATISLAKADRLSPAFKVVGGDLVVAQAITVHAGAEPVAFVAETPIVLPSAMAAGADYQIVVLADDRLAAEEWSEVNAAIGGFHYAPGGNADAGARNGGDEAPAINPCSIWDLNWRPACEDPRGMAYVDQMGVAPFWADIYLTVADHRGGTSRLGTVIADGKDTPVKGDNGEHSSFDYKTAQAALAAHGKSVPSYDEFRALSLGVTERCAAEDDPGKTALDAPRTSAAGIMQATGNMWIWGHDGDPDDPRASVFGGSWLSDVSAGSRYAILDYWPGYSGVRLGARGRSDHLIHG
jgi:hypothetical protein